MMKLSMMLALALVVPAIAEPLVLEPPTAGISGWKPAMKRAVKALENDGYDPRRLDPVLEELGQAVLGPLDARIATASEIVIRVRSDRLLEPIDLLHWRGKPLWLQKPVVYELARHPVEARSWEPTLTTALLISDPTADPENAVGAVKGQWTSTYFKSKKIRPKKLRNADPVDVLLVSAHGTATDEDENVEIGDGEEAYGEDFATVKPRLAYFDSCSMGSSPAFLKAFRKAGTEYYLAPIVSNEAGGSSTHTIRAFFAALSKGRTPVEALFDARRSLSKRYAGPDLLYKAFVFRIYRLN